MITAKLQGRRLVLTVADETGAAVFDPYLVEPISAKAGRELSSRYLFAVEGLPPLNPNGPTVADDMVACFGSANYERGDNELQLGELELLAQTAYFWQSVGGMDAVREMLEADPETGEQGGPVNRGKALAAFRLRALPLLQQISRNLELARSAQMADTPATSTPSGGKTSAKRSSGKRTPKPSSASSSSPQASTPTPPKTSPSDSPDPTG